MKQPRSEPLYHEVVSQAEVLTGAISSRVLLAFQAKQWEEDCGRPQVVYVE